MKSTFADSISLIFRLGMILAVSALSQSRSIAQAPGTGDFQKYTQFLTPRSDGEERVVAKLASFEIDGELKKVEGVPAELSETHAVDGARSLRLTFEGAGATARIGFDPAKADFGKARKLKFDVYRDGDPRHVIVRVVDRQDRRYVAWYQLCRSGSNVIELSIVGMRDVIDVSQVDHLELYSEQENFDIHVDHLRLTDGRDDDSRLMKTFAERPENLLPESVIENGGFELGTLGWSSWGLWDGGDYVFDVKTGDDAYSGGIAGAIICRKPGRAGIWTDPVDLAPGTYLLSFHCKGIGDDVRMRFVIDGDGKSAIRSLPYCEPFEVGPKWKHKVFEVVVGESASNMSLYLFSLGSGTLLIDEVNFVRAGGKKSKKMDADTDELAAEKPRTFTIKGRRTLLDGDPFFPVGVYNALPESIDEGTFNLNVGGKLSADYLDRCRRAGLVSMPNLMEIARSHLPGQMPRAIQSVKDHPAIVGWYVCDEPDHVKWTVSPAEVRAASRMLNDADPNHLTFAVAVPWAESNIHQYSDTVDVLGTDVYPIQETGKRTPFDDIVRKSQVLRSACGPDRPIWMVLQAEPQATAAETKAMAYLAVCGDVDGVIFFEHKTMLKNKSVAAAVRRVAAEFRNLAPILLEPASTDLIETSDPAIRLSLRERDGAYYLLVVNSTKNSFDEASLRLPKRVADRVKSGTGLFDDDSIDVVDDRIKFSLDGFERKGWKLTPTRSSAPTTSK